MNLFETIEKELRAERRKIVEVIEALERMRDFKTPAIPKTPRRRGRKSMGALERKEVSARMKRYWEERRKLTENGEVPATARAAGD